MIMARINNVKKVNKEIDKQNRYGKMRILTSLKLQLVSLELRPDLFIKLNLTKLN